MEGYDVDPRTLSGCHERSGLRASLYEVLVRPYHYVMHTYLEITRNMVKKKEMTETNGESLTPNMALV